MAKTLFDKIWDAHEVIGARACYTSTCTWCTR